MCDDDEEQLVKRDNDDRRDFHVMREAAPNDNEDSKDKE